MGILLNTAMIMYNANWVIAAVIDEQVSKVNCCKERRNLLFPANNH